MFVSFSSTCKDQLLLLGCHKEYQDNLRKNGVMSSLQHDSCMAREKGGELEFLLNSFGDFQSYEINFGLLF
jgi:hypothetical protein